MSKKQSEAVRRRWAQMTPEERAVATARLRRIAALNPGGPMGRKYVRRVEVRVRGRSQAREVE
jgi:hypothetical protein